MYLCFVILHGPKTNIVPPGPGLKGKVIEPTPSVSADISTVYTCYLQGICLHVLSLHIISSYHLISYHHITSHCRRLI